MKIYDYVTKLNESGNPYLVTKNHYVVDGRRTYKTPDDLHEFIHDGIELQNYADEYVWGICLDQAMHLIGCFELGHGTVNGCSASPRELFQKALMIGAVNIAITHNHPSGDPTPSGLDIELTKRIVKAGKLIGINVVDHLVIAKGGYISLFQNYWNAICKENE